MLLGIRNEPSNLWGRASSLIVNLGAYNLIQDSRSETEQMMWVHAYVWIQSKNIEYTVKSLILAQDER